MDSILTSIKKLVGLTENDEAFDTDVIIFINTVFSVLKQLGVGPAEGFYIENEDAIWSDFMPENCILNMAKTFIYLKVKLTFDPPQSSVAVQEMKEQIKELEWRLVEAAESEIQNGGI